MTNEQITDLINGAATTGPFVKTDMGVPLGYLSQDALPVAFEEEVVSRAEVTWAIAALVEMSPNARSDAEQALFSACMESFEECSVDFSTPQEQLDFEADASGSFDAPSVPNGRGDIWKLVKFREIFVTKKSAGHGNSDPVVASVFAECAWDGEHGVALHYEDG